MNINFHLLKHYVIHAAKGHRRGHGVHSPFAYRLCEDVFYNQNPFYQLDELRGIRAQLLEDPTELQIRDFGAGSKVFTSNLRKVNELVKHGTSTQKQSELLFRLCNFLDAGVIIELGGSIGLNALHLAMVNKQARVYSIEGSDSLARFSKTLAAKHGVTNLEVIHATFDEAFLPLLEKVKQVDLLYIDGNHTYDATMRYLTSALPYCTENSVIVLDDIYWSEAMTRAWNEACQIPQVNMSIDCFYFGFLFFKKEVLEKVSLRMVV